MNTEESFGNSTYAERAHKSTFSTPVISHWTRLPMRSPHWSGMVKDFVSSHLDLASRRAG
jgi:hypothetical protein